MDMVSQVEQPGAAMEVAKTNPEEQDLTNSSFQNWGLMIFDTDALLIDPASSSEEDR